MKTREILFEYGFESVNGIVKKHYHLHEIPNIATLCDVWNVLPLVYVRQFTGLTDKNLTRIFEHDRVRSYLEDGQFIDGVVFYAKNGCGYLYEIKSGKNDFLVQQDFTKYDESESQLISRLIELKKEARNGN